MKTKQEYESVLEVYNEKWLQDFKTLKEEQKKLDDYIISNSPDSQKFGLWSKSLALYTEFGEFMNEIPETFKFWKKTAKNDLEKALEEYVDMVHFMLSWINTIDTKYEYPIEYYGKKPLCYYDVWNSFKSFDYIRPIGMNMSNAFYMIVMGMESENVGQALIGLFTIGVAMDFTWEEIYEAYMNKNKKNKIRQDNGY